MQRSICLAILFFSCLPGVAAGATDNVCFGCHDRALYAKKFVHQPVGEGKCGACHNPHVARYKGLLQQQTKTLCYSCHPRAARAFSQGIVHAPVANGDCLACHDAHASDSAGLLKKKLAESCFACHSALTRQYSYAHAPYAKGQCSACHRPHQADNQQLLTQASDTLCLSCHQASTLQQGHRGFPGSLRLCLSCHNPHGSNRKGLIRNVLHQPFAKGCNDCHGPSGSASVDACLRCHEAVREKLYATHSHLTGSGGNGCLACHSPHAGDDKSLLKSREEQVCRRCHEETYRRSAASRHRHRDSGLCSNCHEVHGSNSLAMIKGDGNTVCTACHKNQGQFTHPVGEKVLDPRNGQMVTCTSCHYPMGTDFPFELKQSGKKDLCVLCHKAY